MAFRSRQVLQSLAKLATTQARLVSTRTTTAKLTTITNTTSRFMPVLCNTARIPQRFYSAEASLEDVALELFKTVDKVDAEKLTMDASLTETLGLDSLDITDIIMAFEEHFNIVIADEEIQNLLTVGQCIDLIKAKVEAEE